MASVRMILLAACAALVAPRAGALQPGEGTQGSEAARQPDRPRDRTGWDQRRRARAHARKGSREQPERKTNVAHAPAKNRNEVSDWEVEQSRQRIP